jgi:AcrR family transcriptional regulator
MATPARSGIRMSAEERRASVIAAAVGEFARRGLDGTSTETIAARAGISQPYLFRLFPTKQALFLAAVGRCFKQVIETFERASEALTGAEALDAMGAAYSALITDSDLLLLQLHAYAASSNPEIRVFVRERYAELVAYVASRAGVGPESLRPFFAMGMLCNVVAALGLQDVQELWSEIDCLPGQETGASPPGAMRRTPTERAPS